MVAIVIRALRDEHRWRYPAVFAIIVQLVGSVNATSLLLAGLAPALWIPYAIWVTREVDWRRALATTARIGLLTVLASLWWMAGLWAQGAYGLDVLKYTETLRTVSTSSTATETLRGLGYWFFYGKDKIAFWNEVSGSYTQNLFFLATSFLVPVLAVLAGVVARWRHRAYFVGLVVVGVALSVGAYPYDNPSGFGGAFKSFAESSSAGLALRSSSRATPLVVLGLATLLGVGVNAVVRWLAREGRARLALGAATVVGALVVVSYAPLWNQQFYSSTYLRDDVPEYWLDAIAALDERPHDTRIFEIPGTDFASYRWGGTVEPITPGLTDRPFVARELNPWGSAASTDLLNALDRELQERTLEPESLAAIARLLAAGDIVVRNDLEVDRYGLVRASELWELLHPRPEGLEAPTEYGDEIGPPLETAQDDERSLGLSPGARDGAPVVVYPVRDPERIVRSAATEGQVLVAGSGEGVVDASALGFTDGDGAILYAASFAADPDELRALVADDPDALLLVTDSNRRRAQRWSSLHEIYGYTERAGEEPLRTDTADSRLPLFPDEGDSSRTVVEQRGATVSATGYGTADAYLPEYRATRALDGDVTTSWRTAGRQPAIGEEIVVALDEPVTTDHVDVVQPLEPDAGRYITSATLRFDGPSGRGEGPITVALDESSRTAEGQRITFPERTFDELSITIDDTNVGDSTGLGIDDPVGFAEIRVRDAGADTDVRVEEVVRLPVDLVDAAGTESAARRLVFLLERQRSRRQSPRRGDDEPVLVREVRVPTDRAFDLRGTARLSTTAPDDVIDALVDLQGADGGGVTVQSSARLPGSVRARGSSAFDGDATSAWTTPFAKTVAGMVGQWVEVTAPAPTTFDQVRLDVVADGKHSLPTEVQLDAGGESRIVDVPPVADAEVVDGVASWTLGFPELTGDTVRMTITGVEPVTTIDAQTELPSVLPVAVAELAIPGVPTLAGDGPVGAACRDDLVTIDGVPVPVRVTGDREAAENLRALDLERCDALEPIDLAPIPLAAGDHELRAADGRETGIDVDGITLASAADGAPLTLGPGGSIDAAQLQGDPAATPAVRVLDESDTQLSVRVDDASQPFWLVLGQSQNAGWEATVDGRNLGESTLVDGYANGWRIEPRADGGPIDVDLEWVPQRNVWRAIAISGLVLLLCTALALGVRRRNASVRPRVTPAAEGDDVTADGLASTGVVLGRGATIGGAVGAVVVAALLSRWWVGLVVGIAFVVGARLPRWRWIAALAAPAALVAAAGYVVVQQARNDYAQVLEWPTFFARVHSLAWLAVLLVAADALVDVLVRRRRAAGAEAHPEGREVASPDG
jgi:arabinofuranan 3-O-arabinosyltransferase